MQRAADVTAPGLRLAFPRLVSPAQPVRDIAGLAHTVHGVDVDIAFRGEVFEMEDQRNWTDASYKTYCRPLALPRPYTVAAGERVEQDVTVRLRRGVTGAAKPSATLPSSNSTSRSRLPGFFSCSWIASGESASAAVK